jgi:hypothetical protein
LACLLFHAIMGNKLSAKRSKTKTQSTDGIAVVPTTRNKLGKAILLRIFPAKQASRLVEQGDALFTAGKNGDAIDLYSQAIGAQVLIGT